jgi:hypothetical protein
MFCPVVPCFVLRTKHGTSAQNMEQLDKTWNKWTTYGATGQNIEQQDKT